MQEQQDWNQKRKPSLKELHEAAYGQRKKSHLEDYADSDWDDDDADCFFD